MANDVESDTQANQIANAIVFVADEESRTVIEAALGTIGVKAPIIAGDEAVCIEEMQKNPDSWVIVDMASGMESLVRILIAAQGSSAFDVTPLLLLSPDAGYKTLCLAIEYNVSKVMMGKLNHVDAQNCLKALSIIGAGNKKLDKVMKELIGLRKSSQWKDAISLLDGEMAGSLKNSALFIEQAENYFLSGDFDGAAKIMEDMIAKNPNDLRAVHMMSRILMAQKKVPEAIEMLNEAEKKNQYSASRLIALGDCYLQMGKYRQARGKFTTALGLDATKTEATQGLMQTELLTGNMDEALQMGRSLGSNTDIAKILNMTAIIAIHNNKIEDGLKMYEQSITLLSAYPVLGARVWFNLGLNHNRSGDAKRALSCFETACELDPAFAGAAQNRRVLGKRLAAVEEGSAANTKGGHTAAEATKETIYDAADDDDLTSDDSHSDSDQESADDIEGDASLFK